MPFYAFGVNGSVHSVAVRLAAAGPLALKMQLLQKRRLGLICPFGIRIWRRVDPLIPADHGLMGKERNGFNPEASAQGWQRLIEG